MPWVQIQRAEEATWEDYRRVTEAVGEGPVEGLLQHAAGEIDGHWRAVSVWETKAAFERFRDMRLIPAVISTLGQDFADAGPPPDEWFEIKHSLTT